MDVESLLNSYLKFEDEFNMFQMTINNIKIWHYIRRHIFNDLMKIMNIADVTLHTKNIVCKSYESDWKDFLRENIRCNQFFAQKRDVLVIPSEGKYKNKDGYYRCIYTDLLDRKLNQTHYLLDRKSSEGMYAKQKSKNVLYLNMQSYEKIRYGKRKHNPVKKTDIEKYIIIPIENYFNILLDIDDKKRWLELANAITSCRGLHLDYFNYMLSRIQPKIIIMVCAYACDMMHLCEVAHNRKIPVVELQHGAISRLHIAYNFFEKMNLPSFPDYIFTYGGFERINVRYPIEIERIISVGYPELENYVQDVKKIKKNKNKKSILFISQMSEEIIPYVKAAAETLDNEKYKIVFKLHPSEFDNWRYIYKNSLDHQNIEIVGDNSKTIYNFLAEADWVAGMYSTVLIEATMFDVKIAVLNSSLSINMKELYKNGYAILADSPQRLIEEIMKDKFRKNLDIHIFEPGSINNMLKNIDRIIRKNG